MKIRSLVMLLLVLAAVPAFSQATQPYEPQEGQAVLYASSNCTGDPFLIVQRGVMYSDMRLHASDNNGGVVWEHNIACVHVGPKTHLTLYENRDFGGKALILERTESNPTGRFALPAHWANEVSSLKVQ